MNEKIIKPVSVVRQEFIEKLVNDINNCGLPLFVIEPILQNVLDMVRSAARQQYEADKAQYEQQLNKQSKDSSNNIE